jgi:ERCC4-type nuclease
MFTFKVDHREQKLKEFFDSNNIPCIYENLEFGDFQFIYQDQIIFLFERKTRDDLLASIKDGRYKNQKAKVLQSFPHTKLYYIIEGQTTFQTQTTVPNKIIQSAIINTMLRDKITCICTKTLNETYNLLMEMMSKVKEEPEKYVTQPQVEEQVVVKTSSKDDKTKVFKAMLCQIPGINDKTADVLVDKWKNINEMLKDVGSKENPESYLNEIKVNGRKISKKVVENILKNCF